LPENSGTDDVGTANDCNAVLARGRCDVQGTNLGSCQGFQTGRECCAKTCLSSPETMKWGDIKCPSGSVPLSQQECESSAELRGRPSFGGANNWLDRPYGCYKWALGVNSGNNDDKAFFNKAHGCDNLQTMKECVENNPDPVPGNQQTQWLLDSRFQLICKPTPTTTTTTEVVTTTAAPTTTTLDPLETACKGSNCAKQCEGTNCGKYCTGHMCAYQCKGDHCGGVCQGHMCAFGCTGERCGAECIGHMCAKGCSGEDCNAGCKGHQCDQPLTCALPSFSRVNHGVSYSDGCTGSSVNYPAECSVIPAPGYECTGPGKCGPTGTFEVASPSCTYKGR
jgi:hypothetical protein